MPSRAEVTSTPTSSPAGPPSKSSTTDSQRDPLVPGTRVGGTIRDTRGTPIVNAEVCLRSASASADDRIDRPLGVSFAPYTACARSASDGTYTINARKPRAVQVCAAAVGHVPTCHGDRNGIISVPLRPGDLTDSVDIVMAADAVEVTGRILDLSGGVIPQAMTMGEGTGLLDGVTRARADENGDFSMWVAPGPVTIHASAEGYAPERAEIVAPGRPLRIRLAPAGAIRGVVAREDSGAPVEAAVVMATMQPVSVSLAAPASLEVRTDASGRFALAPLPPGRYRITAVHPHGRGQVSEPITLGFLESVDDVYLTMRAGFTARGHVRFAGDDSRVCTSGSVELYRQKFSHRAGRRRVSWVAPGPHSGMRQRDPVRARRTAGQGKLVDDVVWVVNDGAFAVGSSMRSVRRWQVSPCAQRVESGSIWSSAAVAKALG